MTVTKGETYLVITASHMEPWVTWQREITTWESGNLILNTRLSKLSFETVSSKGCQRTPGKSFSLVGEEPLMALSLCLMASLPL